MTRLNSGIFWVFDPNQWNLNLNLYELDRVMENSSMQNIWVLFRIIQIRAWARTISGKLIQNRVNSRKINCEEFRSVTQTDFWKTNPNMDEFSRNRSSSCLWNFGKISGWVFQNLPIRVNDSDLRASKINCNDTKLEPIVWELIIENPLFSICVGGLGGRTSSDKF